MYTVQGILVDYDYQVLVEINYEPTYIKFFNVVPYQQKYSPLDKLYIIDEPIR